MFDYRQLSINTISINIYKRERKQKDFKKYFNVGPLIYEEENLPLLRYPLV